MSSVSFCLVFFFSNFFKFHVQTCYEWFEDGSEDEGKAYNNNNNML